MNTSIDAKIVTTTQKKRTKVRTKRMNYLFNEDNETPEGMISVSQVQTFLSCRKKWEYGYIEELKPRVERSYLTIGKLCHKGMQTAMKVLWRFPETTLEQMIQMGLEAMFQEGEKYMEITPMLDEELPDFIQMRNDANEVFAQALKEFEPLKYEVLTIEKDTPALELHFKVPCPPTKGLHGYIDAILKDKETGFVWCVDYKFRKTLSPDEDEAFNIQNAVYAYACQKLGIDITGTMTWQHLNTPAADPVILKDGKVSRAKVKTTWEHYADFLIIHGQNPADYTEMQEKLKDIEWRRATLEYRNELTIDRMWNECILPVAQEINSAYSGECTCYRSLYPWNCKMCQYQSLCQAELRDYDADAIKQREYVKRSHVNNENTSPTHESASSLASSVLDE